MVERRDYQAFLRATANEKASMRSVAALLPAAPPRATLWTQAGLLVASSLLPLALWVPGRLDATGVVLLYLLEGFIYGVAVGARVLFTAAAGGPHERPRALTALVYLLWHSLLWSALGLGTLALLAPDTGGTAFASWLRMLTSGSIGLVFGIAYARGRNFWPVIVAHGIIDSVALIALYAGLLPPQ